METENNVKEIADLARAGSSVEIVNITGIPDASHDIPIIARPAGNGAVLVEGVKKLVDEWRTAPERRSGTARMLTLTSLIDFTNRHKDTDSVLFASLDGDKPSLTAVFDYHKVDLSPRFGKHRAVYEFPVSDEWKAWDAQDGKPMTQGDWAAFIEEHVAELTSPTDGERSEFERLFQTKIALPTDLLTLSRGMQVSVEAKVREFRTLQSGEVEVSYDEVHKDGSGQKLIVPGLFIVRIPLFVDADPVRLIARLRYRASSGKIAWFYQLYRPEQIMRAAMKDDADKAVTGTSLPLFEGSPEA